MKPLQNKLEQMIFEYRGRTNKDIIPTIIRLHPETKMKLLKEMYGSGNGYNYMVSDLKYKGIPFVIDTKMIVDDFSFNF